MVDRVRLKKGARETQEKTNNICGCSERTHLLRSELIAYKIIVLVYLFLNH